MKTDIFTKLVLSIIAIFLGCIAFDYKPTMKAEAGIMGGDGMIASGTDYGFIWQMRDGKVRVCNRGGDSPDCGLWSED